MSSTRSKTSSPPAACHAPPGWRCRPTGPGWLWGQSLDAEGATYQSGLWEIDRTGERSARTLIGGSGGLGGVAHLLDGTLLFTSTSADPGCGPDADNENARLWAPPPEGAAASVVATRSGGVDSFRVAHGSGLVVLASKTFPSSTNVESERFIRRERTAGKVTATLHDALPVRWWDANLGPDTPRLYAGTPRSDRRTELKDLTPHAGPALITLLWEAFGVSPDGSTVATPWAIPERGGLRVGLALVDVATASTRLALDDHGASSAHLASAPTAIDWPSPWSAVPRSPNHQMSGWGCWTSTRASCWISQAVGTAGRQGRWPGHPTAPRWSWWLEVLDVSRCRRSLSAGESHVVHQYAERPDLPLQVLSGSSDGGVVSDVEGEGASAERGA